MPRTKGGNRRTTVKFQNKRDQEEISQTPRTKKEAKHKDQESDVFQSSQQQYFMLQNSALKILKEKDSSTTCACKCILVQPL